MTKPLRFILVDDDPVTIMIGKMVIRNAATGAEVAGFTSPVSGLEYMTEVTSKAEEITQILLLDINMPEMTGWEFMEKLPDSVQNRTVPIHIYILSSSVNPEDQLKSKNSPLVLDFIEKPLTEALVHRLIAEAEEVRLEDNRK